LTVDDIPEDNVEGDSSVLVAEQRADPSLASCWKAAEAGRPDFVIHRGILYRKDQVEGQPVSQLCVPEGRRVSVPRLAHDSVFGGHLDERKTRERIRLSFFWPELRKYVLQKVVNKLPSNLAHHVTVWREIIHFSSCICAHHLVQL